MKFTKTAKPKIMLLNKLLEEKRFNDVVKLAKQDIEIIKKNPEYTVNNDLLKILGNALLEIV